MWKLILVLAIWLYPTPDPSDYIILIADDCTQWKMSFLHKKKLHFGFSKSTPDFHSIGLSHGWISPEDSLPKINMRYADILEQNPRYTSELNADDWIKLDNEKRKIYLLRPDDFCSEKRFVLNQEFTLYEVRVGLSGPE
jgi:hypothetical protein